MCAGGKLEAQRDMQEEEEMGGNEEEGVKHGKWEVLPGNDSL